MTRAKLIRVVSHFSCLLVGAIFVFSAITKIVSIDQFELYLFGQNVFGFHLSTIAARFIIGVELLLGIMLIPGFKHRQVVRISLFVLAAFSVFLITKIIGGSQENCNCFGEYAPLNPTASLVKNLLLILLLVIGFRREAFKIKRGTLVTVIVTAVVITIPFVLSPPDILYEKIYIKGDTTYEPHALLISDSAFDYTHGDKVLILSSPSCHYCKMAAKKVSIMAERTATRDDVYFYFFGSHDAVLQFWSDADIEPFPYQIIEPREMIHLADGSFPTVLFLEEGKVVKRSGYRDFSEADFR